MRVFLLMLVLLMTQGAAQAFKLPFRKAKAPQLLVINEDILIEGKFANSEQTNPDPNSVLDLRLAIHIPPDQKDLYITTLYDEINENPIEQIVWVVDNGKKKPPTRVQAHKIDQIINQHIESLAIEYDPRLAYDRIYNNKHIINKTFYYDQKLIFADKTKAQPQFLEIYIPESKGIKTKSIRIDSRIYQAQQAVSKPPEKKKKKQKQLEAPSQSVSSQSQHLEAEDTAEMENAMQQINNFNSNSVSPNNLTPNDTEVDDQEQKQLQQMQEQMQLDSFGEDDYGDEEESF